MALNSLLCADVPLRTYTLTHSHYHSIYSHFKCCKSAFVRCLKCRWLAQVQSCLPYRGRYKPLLYLLFKNLIFAQCKEWVSHWSGHAETCYYLFATHLPVSVHGAPKYQNMSTCSSSTPLQVILTVSFSFAASITLAVHTLTSGL